MLSSWLRLNITRLRSVVSSCSIMWVSSLLLAAGLFLSISALTPEECKPLITPLSLANVSRMYGRVNFIMGYTDNDEYNNVVKATSSSWMNFSSSPSSTNEVVMYQVNKINETCSLGKVNLTIDGNTATMSISNITSLTHVLPSCDGCLLLSTNSTIRYFNQFLRYLNVDSTSTDAEVTLRSFYLMAKGTTVKDSDLEHFKKQASCLGFSGEPTFHYDPENGFCKEDEVTLVQNS